MKKSCSVLKILLSINDGESSRHVINLLIELAQSYACTYLKYRYKNLSKILMGEDVTIDELAIESIAQLFARNDEGVFIKLKGAFENWQPPIETEENAVFFLNRMAAKSVEKYVSELLRDSDPFFAKILDSVNYIIEKQNFKKKNILGTTFIIENDSFRKIGCLPNSQFINELPAELFQEMNVLIPKLFNHVKNNSSYEAAIPLNALVLRIKKLRTSAFIFSDKVEFTSDISIDFMLNNSLNLTIKRLRESYSKKEKLSVQEVSGIEEALRSITLDMKDGGINPGLHKYFLEQFPELTLGEYESKYKNIFEYMYKFLKKAIAVQLKEGI